MCVQKIRFETNIPQKINSNFIFWCSVDMSLFPGIRIIRTLYIRFMKEGLYLLLFFSE